MSLIVLHPGTYSLLVDRGRPKTRSFGIPFGGAADVAAFQIGNALLGNNPNAVALEITLSGPMLQAECDLSCCIFGGPFAIRAGNRSIGAGRVFTLRQSEILTIGGSRTGASSYLCVRGGFHSRQVLNSGTAFQPLAEGARISCVASSGQGRSLEHPEIDALFGETAGTLRVIDGPQADWFPTQSFYQQTFTVSPASNRMGIRLLGNAILRDPRELISEAVAPGAIQITNEGLPIVLGVDGQTIGGYPKIAHVIRADLDRLGQLRPGQSVRFEKIDLELAEELAAIRQGKLKRWLAALRVFAD